jgi:hypothetical protein
MEGKEKLNVVKLFRNSKSKLGFNQRHACQTMKHFFESLPVKQNYVNLQNS